MLELVNIVKHYGTGNATVAALDGVDLIFGQSGFVSVLGPSGCGKTTLLNIIGGLDKYTSGDLVINGKSTKNFSDSDWDSYRNNSVGFVFQNYNLIPHLNVVENVELALTLSGIPESIRKSKAKEALSKVGLADQLKKRPNQLSGGQMQRVAIARALVNDPDIILADEPTGALDSGTSVQIMELLKEISQERLIVMVTHNNEIANRFSTRIIRLLDGKVTSDTNAVDLEANASTVFSMKKSSMSFLTSLKLSFRNLITKRARTILTSFAGSIGIIGIALVLAISAGFTRQVEMMETDTLAAFPIIVQDGLTLGNIQPGTNMEEMFNRAPDTPQFPDDEKIIIYNDDFNINMHYNKIDDDYINYINNIDQKLINSVSFNRNIFMNVLKKTDSGDIVKINNRQAGWQEIISNYTFLNTQYDVLRGRLPQSVNDIVLIIDSYNRLTFDIVHAMGLNTEDIENYSFDDFINMEFRVIPNDVYYRYNEETELYNLNISMNELYNSDKAQSLKIVGILRVKEKVSSNMMDKGLVYSRELTDYILSTSKDSSVAKAQKLSPNKDVTNGSALNTEQYQNKLKQLGINAIPNSISIYPNNIANKALIKDYLDAYNAERAEADQIFYIDISDIITQTMGNIIDGITYVLVAFAAISLVVSSIMIGIITYISVLERTREIGVLRSLGARKKDISRVFNAETLIVGFTAGLMGVVIAGLLTIPINIIITKLVKEFDKIAILKIPHALMLILISMSLTLIAGLIPSRIAAKKDPVIALRTE